MGVHTGEYGDMEVYILGSMVTWGCTHAGNMETWGVHTGEYGDMLGVW